MRANTTRRRILPAFLLLTLGGSSGCVERLLQVRSDPPGATVHINGFEVGKTGETPLEYQFTYYGTFDVIARKEVSVAEENYYSHRELVHVSPPWYQVFPLDFVSEMLIPWTIRDVHTVEIQLEAVERITEAERSVLRERAAAQEQSLQERRQRAGRRSG
jgi:hypothetical protein